MNAAIRAVVRTACVNGIKVYGVIRGYNGLINGDFIEMDLRSVSDIINRGGTILYSARSVEFATEEGMRKAIRTCQEHGIEGVVVIGGDGSFRGARDLSERGIPCVGLPGTIDNDIACCDNTIGYDTCLNTFMEMATSILIPEIEYDIQEHIIERMEKTQRTGKKHFIIIVAEGVGVDVQELAKEIEAKTGVESRACILGHIQRGGSPTAKDRVLATRMGNYAVKLLMNNIGNRVVAAQKEDVVDYDIFEALNMKKTIDMNLYDIAHEVSI